MSPSQSMAVTRLMLEGDAHRAALDLSEQHPDIQFTSGRRSREEQASAMADNIVKSTRQWINRTYMASNARDACQAWIDKHPEAITKDAIKDGLESVLDAMTDADLSHLSKHLCGLAFDVLPETGIHGMILLNAIRNVVHKYGGTFLEREGGLVRWHAQFQK